MRLRLLVPAAALVALVSGLLACGGLFGGGGADPQVREALDGIEPTELGTALAPIQLEAAGAPEMDSGDGVQVLQVAPQGAGRAALQAAVVFDRPMVALTDLDSMTQSAPLSCAPQIAGKVRWVGTTTAVFLPEAKSFPLATAFTCTVPAGTTALDGVALENAITWSFETPRPRVTGSSPSSGDKRWEPDAPLRISFDQAVDPAAVAPFVSVTQGGTALEIEVGPTDEPDPRALAVRAPLVRDTAYVVSVGVGAPGTAGPLGSAKAWSASFRTYPRLSISEHEPDGRVLPTERLWLQFTTPVRASAVAKHLTLSPSVGEGWDPPDSDYESTRWSYAPGLLPRTTYTATVSSDLPDIYGQTLGREVSWTFETGDYRPWLHVGSGTKVYPATNPAELPLRHLNAASVLARLAVLEPDRWAAAADRSKLVDAALDRATARSIEVDGRPNTVELDTVDFSGLLSEGRGWVAARVSARLPQLDGTVDDREREALLVVTDLGGTLKLEPGGMTMWVTRLSDGQPVADAEVAFWKGAKLLGTSTSDKRGLASWDGTPTRGWERWDRDDRLFALVRKGGDTGLVLHEWADGLSPWAFGVSSSFEPDGVVERSHAFADRGVYRPGDPVYARATFRSQTALGLELPPVGSAVTWELLGPRGDTHAEGEGTLDARGGFSIETALPVDGALGDYGLRFEAVHGDEGWRESAYVTLMARAYRPPAFRVDLDAPASAIAGDPVESTARARYLFGAPLRGAEVVFSTWAMPRWFRPDGFDGYSFGPEYRWWDDDDEGVDGLPSTREEGRIEDGSASHVATLPPGTSARPVALFVEASVTDTDRQVISSSSEVLVHPGAFYVGLKAGERLPRAGAETHVDVVAVDADGGPVRGVDVDLRVVRRTWNRVREKGMDGRWTWVNTRVEEEVAAETAVTGREPVQVSWTPAEPGSYAVTATARDDRTNEVTATETLYVLGEGSSPWARRDDQQLELVPEKQVWAPGETARVLVKAPFEGMEALVTAEREGILWRQVVTLSSTAQAVEIPIDETWRPNVFVSVLAVQGAPPQDGPDKGRPQVYMGLVELDVETDAERLDVTVRPSAEEYRPRDEVEVTVAVERGGAPVSGAGVTLYAVDEAILSLTAYKTPEQHERFYSHHDLSVLTADSRVHVLDRAPYLTKGAPRGGGGGEGEDTGPESRTKFVTTVTWQPDLVTGSDGTVTATFTLPDNLTAFRIMAVCDAEATSYGSGEREIRVSRPLIARPALPRLLREGDTAFAGVVVHNNADRARDVVVEASATGPVELTGSPVSLEVPAHGAVEVPFALEGTEQGESRLSFAVSSGADRDAVEVPLPVQRELAFDVVATSGALTDEVTEQIARPDGAFATYGGLDIDLASTVLVGAGSGLEYLSTYPHGCVEQITSKALGSLMALRVHEAASIPVDEAVLRANVDGTLSDLRRYSHSSGGLSYWPGGRWDSAMGTAYAVELMGRARAEGFAVDSRHLDEHVAYLRDVLNGRRIPSGWSPVLTLSAQAYAAAALAHAGAGDAGHNNRLYGHRNDLSIRSAASLLEAIARTTGPDTRTRELARIIESRAYVDATSAQIKENGGGRWARLWGSDDLSTAASLEALLVGGGGQHVLAPKLAKHLASSRRLGRWANTRATAGVLAALAAYADAYEQGDGPVTAELTLAGAKLAQHSLDVPETAHVAIPMPDVRNGPLSIAASGGRLYYETRFRYAPREPEARDEGFSLVRDIEVIEGGGGAAGVSGGAVLRVTLRVVTPVARHNVAVVDPMPAGIEALDASLATTSRAPRDAPAPGEGTAELPDYGGSWVFDHHEIADDQVRLYAEYMPPGVHTFRYAARATTPGTYGHPAATVEAMYQPEIYGRTAAGRFTVGRGAAE